MKALLEKIRKILRNRRTRQILTRTVSVAAALVVFVTTYALVLPAITMETEALCGMDAHQHDESCYSKELVCGLEESEDHMHTEECYKNILTCGKEAHTHGVDCYKDGADLTVQMEAAAVASTESAAIAEADLTDEESGEFAAEISEGSGSDYEAPENGLFEADEHAPAETETLSGAGGNFENPKTDEAADGAVDSAGDGAADSAVDEAVDSAADEADDTAADEDMDRVSKETGYNPGTVSEDLDDRSSGDLTEDDKDGKAAADSDTGSTTVASEITETADSQDASGTAGTGSPSAPEGGGYVPVLEELNFSAILNKNTAIYYSHTDTQTDGIAYEEEGGTSDTADREGREVLSEAAASDSAADWEKVNEDTELAPADLLRVYLAYTIPAGELNETNTTARYRLPSGFTLTDEQINSINTNVNGIAAQYVDYGKLEIIDARAYENSLGIEAVEGTRCPSDDIREYLKENDDQEYVSATVKAENVYDEASGELEGQDLIFTFAPYTVMKNRHEYDAKGKPVKAGEKVRGWVCLDLTTDQIEWESSLITMEAAEDKEEAEGQEAEGEEAEGKEAEGQEAEGEEAEGQEGTDGPAETEDINNTEETQNTDNAENAYNTENAENPAGDGKAGAENQAEETEEELRKTADQNAVSVRQIEEKTAEVIFAEKDREAGIDEISVKLKMIVEQNPLEAEESVSEIAEAAEDEETEAEGNTEDAENDRAAGTDRNVDPADYPAVSFDDKITVTAGSLNSDTDSGSSPEKVTELRVHVEADEGTFPAGTKMRLAQADPDTVAAALEGAVEGKTRGFHAVDISFWHVPGENVSENASENPSENPSEGSSDDPSKEPAEIEPLKPIRVSITSEAIRQAVEDSSTAPVVVHVENADDKADTAGKAQYVQDTADSKDTADTKDTADAKDRADAKDTVHAEDTETEVNKDTLTFEADTFSVYAVVYTVDFRWEVNGKVYDFSIPGGGFASLSHIVEVLGIGNTDSSENPADPNKNTDGKQPGENEAEKEEGAVENTESGSHEEDNTAYRETISLSGVEVSQDADAFMADVESVEFSDSDALWVGRVAEDTLVRELKETNKLEIRYSDALTVKEIAGINAQAVKGGDWALISVHPFTDEELTIAMKDGERFTIRLRGSAFTVKQQVQYTAADGNLIVTATAPVGALPEGTRLQVREISPSDENRKKEAEEEAQMYSEALTAVAGCLKEKGSSLKGAKVCDISFIGPDNQEIEPDKSVDVSISFKDSADLASGQEGAEIGVAHILNDGKAESVEADIDTEKNGKIREAVFSSDTFSVYVVFNGSPDTQSSEPVYLRNGWIRIGGDYEKPSPNVLPDGTHGGNDENGWKNYIRINLYTLKGGRPQNSMNPGDYNLTSTFAWAAGYDEFRIEDYRFNGQVVFTQFHPADRDIMDPQAGMQETYPARTAFHNWNEDSWEVFENVLNVYVNTTAPSQAANKTDYVIRYHHSDGTYHEETGFLTSSSGSLNFSYLDKMKSGEVYSGMTISAGNAALSNVNIYSGSGRINYESTTPVVKVNIYYKEDVEEVTGGTVNGTPQYDTSGSGAGKIYDTSRAGLHTDKTAAVTSNAGLQDGRTFDLTLETWNVGGELANVGMVLDASGSMVWTSDEPVVIRYSDAEWKSILGENYYNSVKGDQKILTPEAVNKILNTANTDYSKLSYNGYKYYVKDPANSVKEYAPLGYYKGGRMKDREGKVASDDYFMTIEIREPTNLPWEAPSYRYYDATAGWYYINSTNGSWYKNHGTAKAYCNYSYQDAWSVDGYNRQTSTKFYIDSTGKLHCKYYRVVSGTAQEWSSDVYMKANDSDTKSEVLQNSIARFVSILNAMSPESEVGMTRFSRNNTNNDGFSANQLPLLNWTNDSAMITAALNQRYGGGTSTGTDPQNGLSVYNYGFTGNTSTYSGMEAYLRYLTNNTSGSYTPTTGNNLASKYLIIFTDGKDTDIGNNPTSGTAVNYAGNLKNAGYTIFTVLMQSAGMSADDVSKSTTFLKTLAGTRTQSGDNYFYSSMYDDPEALVENFRQIALKIAQPLEDYMIRDYIDPRFDMIDSDGTILTQLNPQGAWSPRSITTGDGKSAILKYDTDKKMFYLEIEKQVIPSSPRNATEVTVNTTRITVRAKEDFPGGEDMLTNGNENGQNSVFKPAEESTIHENQPTPADQNAAQKDFPKTTANPATLNITLSNYEDTIFLGETISPAALYESVQIKRDQAVDYRSVYLNYLVRAGQKFQNDPTYYVTLLKYGTVPAGAANTDPGRDINGNAIEGFVFESDANGVTKLTLPYYYLENPGDVTSYAGGTLHQADKVGEVTYSWKALTTGGHTLTDNNALKDYTSTTLDTVRYQLAISYKADAYDLTKIINNYGGIVNDNIANNGSVRTLTLTNQRGTDKLIKDPVGVGPTPVAEQQTDTASQGLAVIHVVAGKFRVIKRIEISDADWTKLVQKGGEDGLTFTFQLKKDGVEYGQPFTINTNSAVKTVNGNYIELTSDWIDNLPKGDYTVEETGQPDGFTFKSVSIAAVTADDADPLRTGGTPFAAPTAGTATWEIGSEDGGVPAAATYAATDFSAAKVMDANKEVDPEKAKAYLNAQIGKGIILNEPPKTIDITLKKVSVDNLADDNAPLLQGASFTITKYTNSSFNVIDTSDPVWPQTLEDVKEGDEYTLNGVFRFTGLPAGFYKIQEPVMPDGYVSLTEDPAFEVRLRAGTSELEIVLYEMNGNTYSEVTGGSTDIVRIAAGNTMFVGNVPGAALPYTGGPGTYLFIIPGIMLMAFAGAVLFMMRQKSK